MNKNKVNKLIQKAISLILSFLLMIFIFLFVVSMILKMGTFNQNTITKCMTKCDYYNYLADYINDEISSYTIPTGLPEEVLEDAVRSSDTKHDADNYIENIYNGKTFEADTKHLTDTINSNIQTYIDENKIELSDEQQEYVNEYIESVKDIYIKAVQVPFAEYFAKFYNLINKYFIPVIIVLLILISITALTIIKGQKWIHRAFRNMAYGTCGSALMLIMLPLYMLVTRFYERIDLSPEYFYRFMVQYASDFLLHFIYGGISCLILTIILIIMVNPLKKRNKRIEK